MKWQLILSKMHLFALVLIRQNTLHRIQIVLWFNPKHFIFDLIYGLLAQNQGIFVLWHIFLLLLSVDLKRVFTLKVDPHFHLGLLALLNLLHFRLRHLRILFLTGCYAPR